MKLKKVCQTASKIHNRVTFSLKIVLCHTLFLESIIIIRNFGIQLRVKYIFGVEKTKFLDTDRIDSVFIHEFVYGSQIRYSLAFLVKGHDKLSLLFKHLYPGFDNMKRVYDVAKQNL
jgi:hypothetical protein